MSALQSIWKYREFILLSIVNEIRLRFSRSKIGAVWIIIHPLVQVIIYATVFTAILSAKLPNVDSEFAYTAYLIAGLLGWTIFSEIVIRCLTVFVDNGNLLKKISFPRICLPVIVCGSVLLNGTILASLVIIILALIGHDLGLSILFLPLIILLTLVLGLSIGLILGVLNVFIRDIAQVVPVVLQLLFWSTPIIYPISVVPERFHSILTLSPIYQLITPYQSILVYNQIPSWSTLFYLSILTVTLSAFSLILFRKAAADMTDLL